MSVIDPSRKSSCNLTSQARAERLYFNDLRGRFELVVFLDLKGVEP
jgi:hypothetical protein